MKSLIAIAFLSGLAASQLPFSWLFAPSTDAAATIVDVPDGPRTGAAGLTTPDAGVAEMLEAFVADYQQDPMAGGPLTFGVMVRDAEDPEWHVIVGERAADAQLVDVRLEIGLPREPAPYYVTDLTTLTAIHKGELASLTAMGKAFSSDFAPLDIEFMEGFEASETTAAEMMRASFHFWTRGLPEVVRFGEPSSAREMHGASGVLFYYQPGFRSGWFRVQEGQHVNADPLSRTNPFPTLVVCTSGVLESRIGDAERSLLAGEAVFIGPEISHEFWVNGDEPAEGVLLMFGDGA